MLTQSMRMFRKPKIALYILVGLVVFVGLFWFMNTYIRHFFASTPTADTIFTPNEDTVAPGDTFSIDIQLSGETITAADIYITYPNNVTYPAEQADLSTGFAQITDYFDVPPVVEEVLTDNDGNKTLHLVLISQKADSSAVEFSLNFQAVAVGEAVFTIDSAKSKLSGSVGPDLGSASYINFADGALTTSVTIVDSGNSPSTSPSVGPSASPSASLSPSVSPSISPSTVPSTQPSMPPSDAPITNAPTPSAPSDGQTPTITLTPATPAPVQNNITLNMKLKFQGVTKQPKEAYRSQTVNVTLQSEDKSIQKQQAIVFAVGGDGIWSGTMEIANVPVDKKYHLFVKGPKHLKRKICSSIPTESVPGQYDCKNGQIQLVEGDNAIDMSGIVLLAGDIPIQDGIVDAVDITFVRNNLGKTTPSVLSRGDLNLDGIVDTQDNTLVMTALGFKYDEN